MTLTEFLLARIAEDEEDLSQPTEFNRRAWAECEAKRRIVENTENARAACGLAPIKEQLSSADGPVSAYWRGQDWACRVLATAYADHPDYREEWKP